MGIFIVSAHSHPARPEGVGKDREARKSHRRDDGVEESVLAEEKLEELRYIQWTGEERVEDSCGRRDQEHVVGEGSEQALIDIANGDSTETYGPRHPSHVSAGGREVGGLIATSARGRRWRST
jgi:hypothetical protein